MATPEKKITPKKKKAHRLTPNALVYILAGLNNTIVTFTDEGNQALCWSSSGSSGFKGTRKSTPHAAQTAAKNAAEKAKEYGVEKVKVFVKGVGPGREQAVRGLIASGMEVLSITDKTSVPHGGCRKRRPRRV